MKRQGLWLSLLGVGIVGTMLVVTLQAQERQAAPAAKAQPASEKGSPSTPSSAASSQPEKVAYTFTDDAQIQQFAQMWQQRQLALTRMAVLQDYFNKEQESLTKMNAEFSSKYNLDVNKNYTLDAQRKALVERELPPEQPGQPQLGQAPGTAPAAAPAPKKP
ncbi:MAG: hypothetical protein HYZ88_00015 [Candidatus Omnitrophica bacterium]|nr:hypothetical protein [Candidatus Omnitrophota bacterium]